MKFFIYSRKSVYTGKGESIENQIEMCRQYISSKFPDTSDADIIIYEDEGFSAKNTDRPQFKQMIRDIRLKKPDYLVCYRLDRISRNVSDFSALIEELNDRNISFVCIKEEFDTSKPMGKAMMYIASVFAQLERETIAERVRDNMLMLARTGRWLGGSTPTGYTSEKVQEIIIDGKIKTSCRLREDPEELTIISTIFEKYLELQSISGVSKYLIKQNIRSRSGNFFSLPGIKDILQNPVYCTADIDALNYFREMNADICFDEKDCSDKFGLLSYNKRDYKKKHAPRRSIDKWIIAIGRHKGRISGKKWVAVQKIIADNIPTGDKPSKMHNDYSLLSGMIYCRKCGKRMFAKSRSVKNPDCISYDYVCSSKLRGGTGLCDCQNINGRQTDDLVCKYITDHIIESSGIYKLIEKLKHDLHRQPEINDPIATIDTAVKKCSDEMDNLINTIAKSDPESILVQKINARITELDTEIRRLTAEKSVLEADKYHALNRKTQTDVLAGELSDLKKFFCKLSVYEKRTVIRLIIGEIIWDGEELHIFINGE